MSQFTKRCSNCKGKGVITSIKMDDRGKVCQKCEGSGIQLFSDLEEEASDALELTGDKLHSDQQGFIDLEEDDYEV